MGTPRVVPPSLRRVPHPSPRARRAPSPRRGRRASSDYTGGDSDADGEAEVDADEASAGRTADSELEDEVERVVGLEQDHDDEFGSSRGRHRPGNTAAANGNGHRRPGPQPVIRIPGARPRVSVPISKGRPSNPSALRKAASEASGLGNGAGVGKGKGKGKAHSAHFAPTMAPGPSSEMLHVDMTPTYTRDDYCSFCAGTDENNKFGRKERMNTCVQCGRSGHPSCLGMGEKLAKKVRTYDWVCMECKTCEVCQIKGDDERLMFCDGCDRGWHSYCVRPAMPKPPKDAWFCSLCTNGVPYHAHPSHSKGPSKPLAPPPASRKGKERVALDTSHTPSAIKKAGRPFKGSADSPFAPSPSDSHKRSHKRKREREPALDPDSAGASPAPAKIKVKLRLSVNKAREMEQQQEEEEEKVPFGGVIQGEDADTAKTSVTDKDKAAFERALQVSEASLGANARATAVPVYMDRGSPAPSSVLDSQMQGYAGPSRTLRNHLLSQPSFHSTPLDSPSAHGSPGPQGPPAALLASNQHKIKHIRFGKYDIDTWYNAPYPEEYQSVPDGRLWLCEFCLKYMKSGFVAQRHRLKCKVQHPPGDEIYRAPIPDSPTGGTVSVFEVDGRKNKIYCQNLCLLAKMFLDHKTLYYDVEPFLFYVMTEVDDVGARFVGYFSKEKRSQDNNVSCIMTLPVRQRKGWGQLLIDFSYALSQKERRVGGPERPLSGLGEVTYKRYWLLTVFRYLAGRLEGDRITLDEISAATSMTLADIYATLKEQDMITTHDTPPPSVLSPSRTGRNRGRQRGRPSVQRKHVSVANSAAEDGSDDTAPIKIPQRYSIHFDTAYVDAVLRAHERKGHLRLQPERLKYHPFLVSRAQGAQRPGLLAKATLMGAAGAGAGTGPGAARGGEETSSASVSGEVTTPAPPADGPMDVDVGVHGEEEGELVERGEDKATLELVARLSSGSPGRALRTRGRGSVGGRESVLGTPKRARRVAGAEREGTGTDELGGTPRSPAVEGVGLGMGEDAEGEEEEEDAEGEEEDAEGEEE